MDDSWPIDRLQVMRTHASTRLQLHRRENLQVYVNMRKHCVESPYQALTSHVPTCSQAPFNFTVLKPWSGPALPGCNPATTEHKASLFVAPSCILLDIPVLSLYWINARKQPNTARSKCKCSLQDVYNPAWSTLHLPWDTLHTREISEWLVALNHQPVILINTAKTVSTWGKADQPFHHSLGPCKC
jgi:hypothetical protein